MEEEKKDWIEKRWRNSKGQWLSTRDVENVRQYYLENFTPEKRPESIRDEVRALDLDTLKKNIQLGQGMFIDGAQMFLVDGVIDSYVDITTNERINLAKRDKSTLMIGLKRVTARELQQALQEHSDDEKKKAEKSKERWYKTLVFLEYNREDNILTWNLKKNESFIARGKENTKKKKK